MFKALGSFNFSNLYAASPAYPLTCLLPPRARAYTRLTRVRYTCGSEPHTLSVMKTLGRTTLGSNAAASATSITLAADPGLGTLAGAAAAGDWVCVALDSGDFFVTPVLRISSLTLTVNALPGAAASGNSVWFFGGPNDQASSQTTTKVVPVQGGQLVAQGVQEEWADEASGLCQTVDVDSPILLYSDNRGGQGVFALVCGCHTVN